MTNYILFDLIADRKNLLPLTYVRPIAEIRLGITTITEKWSLLLKNKLSFLTENYLSEKYSYQPAEGQNCYINGAIVPSENLIKAIHFLSPNTKLTCGNKLVAFCVEGTRINYENYEMISASFENIVFEEALIYVNKPSVIFQKNGEVLHSDFALLTKDRSSQPLSSSNKLIGDSAKIFIEEGATVEGSILNTNTGVIYIAKNAEIMEGSMIRGPLALGEEAGIKMGAKIYGATTIGPHCKVGGEVSNCVFFSYSNKGHDGFLGNSVIAEWCNFGADTNTSNLKNNYGEVDVWNYTSEKHEDTGLQFHGLIMADHAKSGINTMFNTGTVVGVSANVFGADFPPKFIQSFTWGGAAWLRTFIFDKALEVAEKMMQRRNIQLSAADIAILKYVYTKEEKYRKQK